MERYLKVYTYVDGIKDIPFPNINDQIGIYDFSYDAKRMGGAPTINASILYVDCLDSIWTGKEYVSFNGEKYFLKQTPSSSYSNTDSRYKHELEFVSERIILDNTYFFDVVTNPTDNDKYVSNSSKVDFFGDIQEFATRLNYSLKYSKVGYSVVVDEGISTEPYMMSFEDQFFSQVLQSIFDIYKVPFYYVGKVIHIGYTNNAITRTFKYGIKDALLSINKTNANYKIVNRITGVGSSDNIPYYYPNPSDDREAIGANWITPSPNLMPPIYRSSKGAERFYNAKNNTYISPETGEYYIFENQYTDGNPKEHKVSFEDIKPTIKGITNSSGLRIDMFEAFDYDETDNDDIDKEGNYIHPYFFGKLRKFDGANGFNLFDHSIDKGEMIISMTSGSCGACNFIIGVDEDTQKNPVQVHTNGELLRDDKGNVLRSGSPQDIQQDTKNNSVWIALKKDIDTFGVLMPNVANSYRPTAKSDTFVILNIDLPQSYITSAENKLKEEIIKYLSTNNNDKFTFSISFSRIFFAENADILAQLNENARLQIEYNSKLYELYISSYSYKMNSNESLPQITVELADTLTINKGTLQTSIDAVKQDIISSMGGVSGGDILKQGLKYFIRKDVKDYAKFVSFRDGIDVGNFKSLLSGGTFRKDIDGKSYIEVDRLYVRLKAIFENLEIKRTTYVGGEQISSPASMKCIKVEDRETIIDPNTKEETVNIWSYYRCFYLSEQDGKKIENEFAVGDQAICKESNISSGSNVANQYYWRLVVGIGDGYIDLDKKDCDTGSTVPMSGDDIVQLGNRTDKTRQQALIQSTVSVDAPSIKFLQGINSYSLEGKAIISQGYDALNQRAYMKVYGETYIGKQDESSYIKYTPEKGVEIKAKLTTLSGKDIDSEFNTIRDLIDGNIQTWFADPIPTLSNYPANEWITDKEKDNHLGDLYYSKEGKAYRFQKEGDSYVWKLIQDTDITTALAEAKKALDAANNAQTTANEANNNISELNKYIDGAFSDGIITEAEAIAIEKYKNSINETKKNVQASYTKLYNNTYLEGVAKEALKSAYDVLISSIDSLLNKITIAIEDGKTTIQEKNDVDIAYSVFNDKSALYSTAIENANQSIQDKLKSLIDITDNKIAGYEYLKEALNERTTIEGGLILSSNVTLGQKVNDVFTVRSGLNGIFKDAKPGKGISYWAGGPMKDLAEDYPLPWQAQNPPKPTNPSLYANSVIRMDGTGYFAGGAMWIDNTGKIYCDPLSFFVGEEQVGQILTLFTPITTGVYPNKNVVGMRQNFPFEDGTGKGLLKVGKFIFSEDSAGNLSLTRSDGVNATFYVTGGLSAGGFSPSGGGGGGGLIQTVYGYADINKTLDNTVLSDTFNAYTIGQLGRRITTLENSVPKDVVTLSTAQTITGAKTFSTTLSFTNNDVHIKGNNTWLKLSNNTTPRIQIGDLNMFPCVDNATDLGGSAFRWRNIYSTKGYFTDQITSTVATGTAPFIVNSQTMVANLVSDKAYSLIKVATVNDLNLNTINRNGIFDFSNTASNRPYDYGVLLQITNQNSPVIGTAGHWINQLVFGTNSRLYTRSIINTNAPTSWKTIAFIDDNVASTSKLQTPRTIWGQSFDGTGNVSGSLWNVTDINMSGSINMNNGNIIGTRIIKANSGYLDLKGNTGMAFYTNDSVKGIFTTSGDFGVGTVSPNQKFTVIGGACISGNTALGNVINPLITLALGDSDTGFNWQADGIFRVMSNGQTFIEYNSNGNIYTEKTMASRVAQGIAPISTVSTTVCPNLNSQYLGGRDIDNYTWGQLHGEAGDLNDIAVKYPNMIGMFIKGDSASSYPESNTNWHFIYQSSYNVAGEASNLWKSQIAVRSLDAAMFVRARSGGSDKIAGWTAWHKVLTSNTYNAYSPSLTGSGASGNWNINASSATKLQTARSINGTNFDGTGDITTYRWGNARTIYIQSYDGSNTGAGVNIDGSGNAILKLAASIACADWFRSNGDTGWYNNTYGGGIYMKDSNFVRIWNSKRFYPEYGIVAPYEGSSWISMATRTSCIVANRNNSSAAAHALFRTTFNNGRVLAYGGLNNEMGFYGFTASDIANNVNTYNWSTKWDSDGNFTTSKKLAAGNNIYAHGQAYTLTCNTIFNPINSTYGDTELNTVSHNQYKPMIGWHDQISGQGYITKYNIGSYRVNTSWGKMILAVSNNDYGNSIGAEVDISGDGWVDVGPKLRINGLPIYKYSDGVLYFDCSIAARGGIAAGIAGGSGVPVPTVTQTGSTFQFTNGGYCSLRSPNNYQVVSNNGQHSYLGDGNHVAVHLEAGSGKNGFIVWDNNSATLGPSTKPGDTAYLACWGKGGTSYIYLGTDGSATNTAELAFTHYGFGSTNNEFQLGFWGGTAYGRLRLRAHGSNFMDGSFTASGSITPGSDIRRKNITRDNIRLTLDQIANAPSIEFLWKDLPFDTSTHCGTTAQYWLGVLPSSVNTKDPDYLSLDYNGLTMIASISLANEIKELKKENAELKNEIEVIKSLLSAKDN